MSDWDIAAGCLLATIAVAIVLVLVAWSLYLAGPMRLWT